MNKTKKTEPIMPLFEYSKRYEDYETYDGFDAYFIHCIHTCGIRKTEISKAMGLSESGLSLRMNLIGFDGPRFSTHHIQAYVELTGDPRPWEFLKWLQEKASTSKESTIKEMINHLNSEMKRLSSLLEGKE